MKKNLMLILLIVITVFITGCYVKVEEDFYMSEIQKINITVGEQLKFQNIEYDLESNILVENNGKVYASNPGEILIKINNIEYYLIVTEEEIVLNATSNQLLEVGQTTRIQTNILPANKSQNVIFESTDENIITVNKNGSVRAIANGVARVIIKSSDYENVTNELTFVVLSDDEKYYDSILNNIIKNENINIDLDSNTKVLEGVINYNSASLVGVSSYKYFMGNLVSSTFGAGIIYKMNTYYIDGTIKENTTMLEDSTNIKEFEYYVITNKHLIYNYDDVRIYLNDKTQEISAEVIEYDDKIDLAVLKFKTKYFLPVCKLGDSEEVETGEFILSIGHGQGKEYFKTYTFGIVSGTKRYVNTDTDNDGVNDWDSEYIQHDASLNECDSGGAIVNMKGEIIGINSTKVSSDLVNNMSFAIPINLVMEIVSQLEQGIRPKRATLGVQIFDVTAYHQNPEYYQLYYPNIKISKDIKYGFYVSVVDRGSISEKAGVLPGDIIVEFNNVELKYSYQVRAELGKFLIGSGETAEMVVIRNNQRVTLYVVF